MKYVIVLLLALFIASCGSNPVNSDSTTRKTGPTRDTVKN